jgi:hypothetical protein
VNVCLPRTWNTWESLRFIRELDRLRDAPDVCLDFTTVDFARPFGTLLIAECVKEYVTCRKAKRLETHATYHQRPEASEGAAGYLGHVGFFQYIGLQAGKAPGEAKGSQKYVPIQCIERAQLIQMAGQAPIQEAIEKRSDQLAEVVFPHMTEQLMMSYCLREVIRNVFEHAQTDTCTVMAQRYSDGTAQIAIIDRGIGIYRSLCTAHACRSVDDALHLALQPGTSRVVGDQTGQRWDNSGFGLYILSELGRELGNFLVVSNGRFLQLRPAGKEPVHGNAAFNGTGIKLTVDLVNAAYFPNLLHRIVATGEEQLALTGDKHRKASTSSKSLSQQ